MLERVLINALQVSTITSPMDSRAKHILFNRMYYYLSSWLSQHPRPEGWSHGCTKKES